MKVKIKATGFGATALKDGTILHFDKSESDKPKAQRDMRKLEAEVDIDDANRIKELGWGDFVSQDDADAASEGARAELGDAVAVLEQAPAVEPGKPSQVAPREDRDDPAANAHRLATGGKQPRAKRPSEVAKDKAKEAAKGKQPAKPADAPKQDQQTGDDQGGSAADGDEQQGSEGDPDAGPAT